MKKGLLVVACAAALGVFCGKKEEGITGEVGGKMVIGTMDLSATLSPLSPSLFGSNDILDLLFLHLHRIDPATGKMKPELAESWEFSEDLTAITYYLRRDVKWWDGQPVTAEDVFYTFERMNDPQVDYPDIARLRFIKQVEVLNPYAIRFTFDRVYADLLTDSDIMPVPKHVHEKDAAGFGANPVGNGPYRIKEWTPGAQLILAHNADFYRGRPPLDEIHIRNYVDAAAMVNDYAQGALDVVLNITPQAAQRLTENKNVLVDSRPGNSYLYIGWNLNNELLKDKDVRTALTMAIDRSDMLKTIFGGMGTISLGPLPPSSWGFNDSIQPIAYDPQKARDILARKGFEDRNRNNYLDRNGKEVVLTLITNTENPERVQILNAVVEDLKAIGIRVNARTLDAATFIGALVNKNFDGFIMGWNVSDRIDPTVYWHSDPMKSRYNFTSYHNPRVDSLIDLGVTMLNRNKAREIWREFQRLVYEDQPYTFLIAPNALAANYKRVKGADQGIALASAHTYWIPESERRIVVAAVVPEVKPVEPAGATPTVTPPAGTKPEERPEVKPPAVVAPERLLEAAAKKETTTTVVAPPPVAPPQPSVVTKPVPTKQIRPRYPESARALNVTGRVVVRVVVGVDGKVKGATVLSSFGNPACEEAALAAARQWEFNPATKDGEPFEQNVSIPFDFKP